MTASIFHQKYADQLITGTAILSKTITNALWIRNCRKNLMRAVG